MLKCQLWLAFVQTSFVCGAVYFKYSVNHDSHDVKINPVVFAFIREIIAGSVMCCVAYLTTRQLPKRSDARAFIFLGALIYFNQLFYILGMELSGVIVATCMQPAIPVFTVALAITLGREEASFYKTMGILCASAGAICMVAGGGLSGDTETAKSIEAMHGNVLLFLNTIAMALYYIYAKPVLKQYPPMVVAAWTYIIAAACMGTTAVWYNRHYSYPWTLSEDAYGPLIYWIFVCSVTGYYIIAWAMKHLPSTEVAAFQCLQPLIGTILGFIVLGEKLTFWDLGALGVIVGLFLVNRANRPSTKLKTQPLPEIEVRKPLL